MRILELHSDDDIPWPVLIERARQWHEARAIEAIPLLTGICYNCRGGRHNLCGGIVGIRRDGRCICDAVVGHPRRRA